MLSIARGYDTAYLTDEVARGREGYYVDAVEAGLEPAGRWHGAGAEALGLTGEVDTAVLEAVYARLADPRGGELPISRPNYRSATQIHADLLAAEPAATPERRQEMWAQAQSKQRQPVSFLDATFSAPKSVSVLTVAFERAAVEAERAGRVEEADGWRAHLNAVEEAVMVGARASIDYLEEVAGYSRAGKHGAGADRWVDAHRFVVAQYLQHDSRERDPQLHVHQAILNAVECADGKWRTLDGQALYLHRPAAGAVGERAMEAYLADVLGIRVATRPDGKAREVVGVDQHVMAMFSSRVRAITPKLEQLCREWERVHGRPPNQLERSRLAQQATLATRPGKSHDGESLEQRLERWEQQTRADVGSGLRSVAEQVLAARQDAGPVDEWDPTDVVERAVARVSADESTWTRSDLMRAVSDCLPGHLGLSPGAVRPLLEQLTDAALAEAVRISPEADLSLRPAEHLLANGADVYRRFGSERHAAPGQLPAEQALRAAAVERGAMRVPDSVVDGLLARYRGHGVELGADQAAALRGILTSGAQLEVVSAAAGTGKSVLVGALSDAWAEHGRAVLGLAPSQNAADVLVDEGVAAVNIDRWLMQRDSGLSDGDIVVVDESSMASTQQLTAVRERCRAVGAKLLLVGDPDQLGAVGPGGALQDLTEHAKTYELAEVRRFTHPWERTASLDLRAGNQDALDAYERAGRIRAGGTAEQAEAQAVRAWLADTLQGRDSLLMAGSNEQAERMAGQARAELVRLGRVPEEGIRLGRDGNTCSVGDIVQARHNGWRLGTARAPINRATYRVVAVRDDGGLSVAPIVAGKQAAAFELPADYVATNMTLGYASTVHAGQGRTVDTAHAVISPGSSRSQTYVGLTRGRQANTAWCVTRPTASDAPVGEAQDVQERTGRAVLADILERDSQQRSAMAERDALEAEASSELSIVGQLVDGIHRSTAGQTSHLLDMLAARDAITAQQRQDLAADSAMSAVERLLRAAELAGHDRAAVLERALGGRSLQGAKSVGQVLHHRIHRDLQVASTLSSFRDLIPPNARPEHQRWLESRADDADTRRHELGAEVAADPPAWALQALGPVPEDVLDRQEWEQRAGWAAASREQSGHDSETDPLGPAPPAGLAEKLAIWRTAHVHLGLTDRGPEEGLLSDGQLRARVAAFEREKNWAAASVRGRLADTTRAADERRVDGVLYEAHGDDTAMDAQAEAVVLEETTTLLDEADRARQAWTEHTSQTAEKAQRARAELAARDVDLDDDTQKITAREWLDEHRAAQEADEQGKPVDRTTDDDHDADELAPVDEQSPETLVPDARDAMERHPSEDDDQDGAPSIEEARELVARAQATLAEIAQRESLDAAPDDYGYDLHDEDLASEDELADVWD